MTDFNKYMDDGANYQAKAVLAYLTVNDGIEESWSAEQERYTAEPKVARWGKLQRTGLCYFISFKTSYQATQHYIL